MYGLMKAHVCSRHAEEAHHRRLHYCGTCKTMGRLYGQKTRFLLNNDAVFLAELLTAISPGGSPLATWDKAYPSYNCFALPANAAEMPLSLQVAATATIVMTEFKVADQIADTTQSVWKLVHRVFSQSFLDAVEQMRRWNFPVETLWQWGGQQEARERVAREEGREKSAKVVLEYVAEPTATVTGLVFQYGAATVGADAQTQEAMYALGFAFGAMVYLLDAFEDYARDVRRKDFNALQTAFQIQGKELPACYHEAARTHILEQRRQIEAALQALPLSEGEVARFTSRLRTNVAHTLGEPSAEASCSHHTPRSQAPLSTRWNAAVSLAKTLSTRHREQQARTPITGFALPFIFVTVLAIGLLAPRQALAMTSYQECRDLAFNLMFVAAAAKALATAPMRLLPAGFPGRAVAWNSDDPNQGSHNLTHSTGGRGTSVNVVRVRRRPSCCAGCCEDCACSCGDCCCDFACCEASQCCCDGCSCAECACSGGCCPGCVLG